MAICTLFMWYVGMIVDCWLFVISWVVVLYLSQCFCHVYIYVCGCVDDGCVCVYVCTHIIYGVHGMCPPMPKEPLRHTHTLFASMIRRPQTKLIIYFFFMLTMARNLFVSFE